MRPEAGRTRTRIVQRFLGTVIGLLVITLLVALLEPGDARPGADLRRLHGARLRVSLDRLHAFNAGVAGAVVALAAILGLPEPIAALNRFIDTLTGLAIVLCFLLLLPEVPRRRREPAAARG